MFSLMLLRYQDVLCLRCRSKLGDFLSDHNAVSNDKFICTAPDVMDIDNDLILYLTD